MSDNPPAEVTAAAAPSADAASGSSGAREWAELLGVAGIALAEQDLELRYTATFAQPGVARDVELLGKREDEVFAGETLAQLVALKRQVIDTGVSRKARVRAVIDGEERWFETSVTPRRDDSGRTVGVLSLRADLTETVRTGEQARASETRLASLLDAAGDAIISMAADRRITFFNPAAQRMFGVTADAAIGTDVERFVPALTRHLDASVTADQETGVTGRRMAAPGALCGVRADGQTFPVEATVGQSGAGADQLFTVIVRDRSEHDHVQAQLLQSQKLEGMGRLAGGVAHDFNNLLTVILGYCELLRMRQRGGTELEEINNAAQRASHLTRQLLAFSRRQILHVETLELNGLIRGLNRMLRRISGEDVRLQIELGEEPMWVVGDVSQIEQVLLNLVVNARDAMPNGGTLRLATRLVEHSPRSAGGLRRPSVELAVADSGVGMTEDVQARMFEPFFTTKGDAGTGLGLSTVYGIVTQTGGDIDCTSAPGEGSTFRVWLPLAAPPPESALGPAVHQRSAHGHETVLLVEDEMLVRELAARALREYGYTVLEAGDADTALRFVDHPRLAIVVSDVVMPGGSGDDLPTEIARRRPGLPVLRMTGYSEALLQQSIDPAYLLRKPFTPADLVAKIRHLLDTARDTR